MGFLLVDRDFRIMRINDTLARSAAGRRGPVGWTVAELVPAIWPQIEDAYRRALAGEPLVNLEVSRPSGRDEASTG